MAASDGLRTPWDERMLRAGLAKLLDEAIGVGLQSEHEERFLDIDRRRAALAASTDDSLDAAWAAAEAALPEGWAITVVSSFDNGPRAYLVSAMNRRSTLRATEGLPNDDGAIVEECEGLTPAAALRRLAAALSADATEGTG